MDRDERKRQEMFVLQELCVMTTYENREQFVIAHLKKTEHRGIISHVNWEGSAFVVSAELVSLLYSRGEESTLIPVILRLALAAETNPEVISKIHDCLANYCVQEDK
jgi:hypothetical protein